MDQRDNPYTPNAGAMPPVLVGREDQVELFATHLDRLRTGHNEQSLIVTGLRGVGKTVLLSRFREIALAGGWAVAEVEAAKHDDDDFRAQLSREFRRVLVDISPRSRWQARAELAASVLRSFSISVDPDGRLTAGFGVDAAPGRADSGALDADLSDLLLATGDAAADHHTGVLLLVDEIQFLKPSQFEALIIALHKCVQRNVPVTVVGAGLPQVAALAGVAKSYAERLFVFSRIGALSRADCDRALAGPAAPLGLTFADDALGLAFDLTGGYPYFIQELGYAIWPRCAGPVASAADVRAAQVDFEAKLDDSFFRVRLERTTTLERAYLRAMAELGTGPQSALEVARLLRRTVKQVAFVRSTLVNKGLIYTPEHGMTAFSVPHFDRFIRRAMPKMTVPALRRGKRG